MEFKSLKSVFLHKIILIWLDLEQQIENKNSKMNKKLIKNVHNENHKICDILICDYCDMHELKVTQHIKDTKQVQKATF